MLFRLMEGSQRGLRVPRGTSPGPPTSRASPVAGDTVGSPSCDSWVPSDQAKPGLLGWPSQLSCPSSVTLPDVRQEDL